jgi:bzd-type benzoyl-CoA reductase Q subunit
VALPAHGPVVAGIDVGSVSSQAVVLSTDGRLCATASLRTGASSPHSAERALQAALAAAGLQRAALHYSVGTGYGRANVVVADRTMTEIACHARGARRLFGPTLRTVLDMGGQDCKAIRLGPRGKPTDFLMNDRCAAGTGRGLEVFADLLDVALADIGSLSLQVEREPSPLSSTCVVFAKSEALGLLRRGWSKNEVLAAYCNAMAKRVSALIKRLGVEAGFGITGGIAKNRGVVERIERRLGLKALKPAGDITDVQLAGALGAALFAHALTRRA